MKKYHKFIRYIKKLFKTAKTSDLTSVIFEDTEKAARDYHLIFVTGGEGSGTTMLNRILASSECVVNTHYHSDEEHKDQIRKYVQIIRRATKKLWFRQASFNSYQQAKIKLPAQVEKLFRLASQQNQVSHIAIKRSSPFLGKRKGTALYRPDLHDLVDLFKNLHIVVLYRDPKAAAYSALKRGFTDDIKQAAVRCEEHLTYLAAQLGGLDPKLYRIISYEKFVGDPMRYAEELAEFCQLSEGGIVAGIQHENVSGGKNERWKEELLPEEMAFIEQFFDDRRLSQWSLLHKGI